MITWKLVYWKDVSVGADMIFQIKTLFNLIHF